MNATDKENVLTPDEARIAASPIPAMDWLSTGMKVYYILSALALPVVVAALYIAAMRRDVAWGVTILMFGIVPPFNVLAGFWFALAYLSIFIGHGISKYRGAASSAARRSLDT